MLGAPQHLNNILIECYIAITSTGDLAKVH